MNALNIISGLGSSNANTPAASRSSSLANLKLATQEDTLADGADGQSTETASGEGAGNDEVLYTDEERTPLAEKQEEDCSQTAVLSTPRKSWRLIPKRIADIITTTIAVILSTLLYPFNYLISCFYDSDGAFSALLPLRRLYQSSPRKRRRKVAASPPASASLAAAGGDTSSESRSRSKTNEQSEEKVESKSEDTAKQDETQADSPAHNTRSKTNVEDNTPSKRSIRIKIQPDAAQKKRHSRAKSMESSGGEDDRLQAVANALKSPSSPLVHKLKYPRAPAPPRPLVPRRQPSYSNIFSPDTPKKTLILDLDETLIHSMAKGGRMSTGHMVEVKFTTPVGAGGMVIGPQVPILYYVHERPHCHEFLRKVCKWFNLVIFTASVQEYADPVIDWLERERAYFAGRYYRQHCTYRNGAYIKDLSQVEPDLSKVMILDNSPMSYIFHEDNAIPIEGWISDPTDNDLLHLVPFLEGLQYVTDVRALLALRMGQTERA